MRTHMAQKETQQDASLPALFKRLLGCSKAEKTATIVLPLRAKVDTTCAQNAATLPYLPKRLLGYAAAIALLAGYALGQTPTPVYNDFSPLVKGVTVGPDHCYFWLKQPGMNDVHTACYLGGALVYNAIDTLGTASGAQGKTEGEADWNGATIKWCFTLGTFTLSVTLPDGTTPLVKSGTF